jgi:hypothetical protein
VIPLLNDRPGIRLYADGPRIAVFTTAPESGGRTTALADLRRDDLRGLIETAADGVALAEKKLWFGLLQGALEHEAMTEYVGVAGGDVSHVTSTTSAFSEDGVIVLTRDSVPQMPAITDPESRARLQLALDNGHIIGGSKAGLEAGFWWEVATGSGDTRAVAALGLHGVAGRNLPPPQIKNAGKGGTFGTPEYVKELKKAENDAWKAKKEAEAIAEYQKGLGKNPGGSPNALGPPKRGGGGGELGEYVAALAASVLYAVAYHILSNMLLEKLISEIELLVDWLKAGGFRKLVEQP